MIRNLLVLICAVSTALCSFADVPLKAFTSEENLFIQFENSENKQITFKGQDSDASLASPTGIISFFHAGSLNEVLPNGNLSINVTGTRKNNGRYYHDRLFDTKVVELKAIGRKE